MVKGSYISPNWIDTVYLRYSSLYSNPTGADIDNDANTVEAATIVLAIDPYSYNWHEGNVGFSVSELFDVTSYQISDSYDSSVVLPIVSSVRVANGSCETNTPLLVELTLSEGIDASLINSYFRFETALTSPSVNGGWITAIGGLPTPKISEISNYINYTVDGVSIAALETRLKSEAELTGDEVFSTPCYTTNY